MGTLTWPGCSAPAPQSTWRAAIGAALYGPGGFYRSQRPAAHFRTAPIASPWFAEALHRLAIDCGLGSIVDIGAGDGKFLRQLHRLDPRLDLTGVELRPRPEDLPRAIGWRAEPPEHLDGLVIANEWLDNVPLELTDGTAVLTVDGGTVPISAPEAQWLRRWWPQGAAEIGVTRDEAWTGLVRRIGRGLAIAIDYGHRREDRPLWHTLTGYRDGRSVDPVPDGSCDLTAHVAVDSVLAAGSSAVRGPGLLVRQRTALHALGIRGRRPPIELAHCDPARYLRELARAGEAGELTATGGLGGFWWIMQPVGIPVPPTFGAHSRAALGDAGD